MERIYGPSDVGHRYRLQIRFTGDLGKLGHHLQLPGARCTKIIEIADRNPRCHSVNGFVSLRAQFFKVLEDPLESRHAADEKVTLPGKAIDAMIEKKDLGVDFVIAAMA